DSTRRQSANVMSSNASCGKMPALLMRMSQRPKRCSTLSASAFTASGDVTSHVQASAFRPARPIPPPVPPPPPPPPTPPPPPALAAARGRSPAPAAANSRARSLPPAGGCGPLCRYAPSPQKTPPDGGRQHPPTGPPRDVRGEKNLSQNRRNIGTPAAKVGNFA